MQGCSGRRRQVAGDCTYMMFHVAGAQAEHRRPRDIEKWVAGWEQESGKNK